MGNSTTAVFSEGLAGRTFPHADRFAEALEARGLQIQASPAPVPPSSIQTLRRATRAARRGGFEPWDEARALPRTVKAVESLALAAARLTRRELSWAETEALRAAAVDAVATANNAEALPALVWRALSQTVEAARLVKRR
jgi:hypothetical protein